MVLLITPNSKDKLYGVTANGFSAIQPNIYMAILDSYLNHVKKTPCDMINLEAERMTNEQGAEYVVKVNPEKVGIICSGSNPSASTMSMVGAIDLCHKIKAKCPNIHVFLYGGHPTVLPEQSLRETGADEIWGGDCLDCDIDDIPMVDWDRINPSKYVAHNWHCLDHVEKRSPYAVVWTSLGCPYSCSFCCVKNLFNGKPYRMRSMKNVVAEIDVLYNKFGVRDIKIMDELFVIDHPRIDEFCDLLEQRNYDLNMWCFSRVDTISPRIMKRLKSVGMNWIAYGFESINQDNLDNSNKRADVKTYERVIRETKNAGINIIADIICGFPDDDYIVLDNLKAWVFDKEFDFINLYPLFNYPGTPSFHECNDWSEYSIYGEDCLPAGTKFLTSKEVVAYRDNMFEEYLKSKTFQRNILNKFGSNALKHIQELSNVSLKRSVKGIYCGRH